jgi:predicted nucleic acid-binding protein
MKFLDANVILRYLTRDDPKKAENCYELFQKVKRGEIVSNFTSIEPSRQ